MTEVENGNMSVNDSDEGSEPAVQHTMNPRVEAKIKGGIPFLSSILLWNFISI